MITPMDNTQAIKEYNLQVVGISFKTAPVELREKLAVAPDHIPGILSQLHHISGVQEILLLSTCNRVEIYGVPEEDKGWEEDIFKFLLDKSGLLPSQLRPHIYIKNGWQTLQHLFRVAASLDSMVVGEPQILGQLKEAYKLANKSNSCGKNLTWILPRAFKVAKRIRHETGIGSGLVSVSHIAIELSKRIFSDLQSRQVILVGAGKMGVLAARALLEHISEPMIIINRSLEKAQELATDTNGIAAGMDQLDNRLLDADIAIISTGAADYVLTEKEVFTLLRRRRYRPLFLIDLSVPRNIDPAVNKLDNVYLYDIDALESIARENINSRQSEVVKA